MAMTIIDLTGNGDIPYPAKFSWVKDDISADNAGRTRDTIMHKNKQGEKRTLSLGWIQKSKEQCHAILVQFKPEYVHVKYWDPMEGKDLIKQFYTGQMKAEVGWWYKGRERYSTLSFDIIEV